MLSAFALVADATSSAGEWGTGFAWRVNADVLRSIPGVTVVHVGSLWNLGDDLTTVFEYEGRSWVGYSGPSGTLVAPGDEPPRFTYEMLCETL